jgi:hypothetical protein
VAAASNVCTHIALGKLALAGVYSAPFYTLLWLRCSWSGARLSSQPVTEWSALPDWRPVLCLSSVCVKRLLTSLGASVIVVSGTWFWLLGVLVTGACGECNWQMQPSSSGRACG